MSLFDRPVFIPVCAWIVDNRENQHAFGDWAHQGLYRSAEPDAQGHRYVVGEQIQTSCTWITDEKAVELMKKHLVMYSDLGDEERVLLIRDFKNNVKFVPLEELRQTLGGE